MTNQAVLDSMMRSAAEDVCLEGIRKSLRSYLRRMPADSSLAKWSTRGLDRSDLAREVLRVLGEVPVQDLSVEQLGDLIAMLSILQFNKRYFGERS